MQFLHSRALELRPRVLAQVSAVPDLPDHGFKSSALSLLGHVQPSADPEELAKGGPTEQGRGSGSRHLLQNFFSNLAGSLLGTSSSSSSSSSSSGSYGAAPPSSYKG